MSLILPVLGVLAAALVLLSAIVELNDLPSCRRGEPWSTHLRHHCRALGLVLVGACSGMTGFYLLAGQSVQLLPLGLVLGMALGYAGRSREWLRYVLSGDRRGAARDSDRRAA